MSISKNLVSLSLAAITLPVLHAASGCPENVVSLHLRLVQSSLIVVPVQINQSGPYDFIVDTGAQTTTVDPSLASELHLATEGTTGVGGVATFARSSYTYLESLQAGSHSQHTGKCSEGQTCRSRRAPRIAARPSLHAPDSRVGAPVGRRYSTRTASFGLRQQRPRAVRSRIGYSQPIQGKELDSETRRQRDRTVLRRPCSTRCPCGNSTDQAGVVHNADECDRGQPGDARRRPAADHGVPAGVHQLFRPVCDFGSMVTLDLGQPAFYYSCRSNSGGSRVLIPEGAAGLNSGRSRGFNSGGSRGFLTP